LALTGGLLLSLVLPTGCGPQPLEEESGVTGFPTVAGDVFIHDLYVADPPGGAYAPGTDPIVHLTLVNQGTQPEILTAAQSPLAREVHIHWDRSCDGEAEAVDALPLIPQEGGVPAAPAAHPFDAYHLQIIDLNETVRSGTHIPLVLTFHRSGELQVQAPVEPREAYWRDRDRLCHPVPETTPMV